MARNKGMADMTGSAPSRLDGLSSYDARLRKRRRRKVLVGILVTVVALIVAGGGVAFAYINGINTKLTAGVSDTVRAALTEPEKSEDPFYMLLLGVDKDQGRTESSEYGPDESSYRSDSIILARVDPINVKVTMISIHRDTLIDMGEFNGVDHGNDKINAAYSYGQVPYTIQVVSQLAGVPIAHYAEVDIDRFMEIVDKVGGVTITLDMAVRDPNYTGIDLDAGEHTIDGYTAAMLARSRHAYDNYGDGDVYRAANQRMIISAVIKKVLQLDPISMANTVSALADSVTTDMDLGFILSLASQMSGLNTETDIYTAMEPTQGQIINGTYYEILMKNNWQRMMERTDAGLPPVDENSTPLAEDIASEYADTSSSSGSDSSYQESESYDNSYGGQSNGSSYSEEYYADSQTGESYSSSTYEQTSQEEDSYEETSNNSNNEGGRYQDSTSAE